MKGKSLGRKWGPKAHPKNSDFGTPMIKYSLVAFQPTYEQRHFLCEQGRSRSAPLCLKLHKTRCRLFFPLLPVGSQESVFKAPKRGQLHAAIRVTKKRFEACAQRAHQSRAGRRGGGGFQTTGFPDLDLSFLLVLFWPRLGVFLICPGTLWEFTQLSFSSFPAF